MSSILNTYLETLAVTEGIAPSIKILDRIFATDQPVPEKEIVDIERKLKVKLHKDYRALIQRYGFLTDEYEYNRSNDIAGAGALEQQENVVFLNNSILKDYKKKLKKDMIFISYENQLEKLMILSNNTGVIWATDYWARGLRKMFPDINALVKRFYG